MRYFQLSRGCWPHQTHTQTEWEKLLTVFISLFWFIVSWIVSHTSIYINIWIWKWIGQWRGRKREFQWVVLYEYWIMWMNNLFSYNGDKIHFSLLRFIVISLNNILMSLTLRICVVFSKRGLSTNISFRKQNHYHLFEIWIQYILPNHYTERDDARPPGCILQAKCGWYYLLKPNGKT